MPSCNQSSANQNVVRGSCECLNEYIQKVGVQDALGGTHKGWVGVTTWDYDRKPTLSEQVEHCETCRKINPKTDCIPIACDDSPSATNVCHTIVVHGTYQATTAVRKLTWQPDPPACNTCLCGDALASLNSIIDRHEQQHVADVQEAIKDANLLWTNKEFEACGKNFDAAKKDLTKAFNRELIRTSRQIDSDVETKRIELDKIDHAQPFVDEACTRCVPCPQVSMLATSTVCCPEGQTECAGACADLQIDSANCGSCGNACTGGKICQGGQCKCPSTQTSCGTPEVCVDLNIDNAHCGDAPIFK